MSKKTSYSEMNLEIQPPNSMINKKEFQKIAEKIDQKSENNRNQAKLRSSSKKKF